MRSLHVIVLATLLSALGLGIFAYKVEYLGFPLTPGESVQSWNLEVRLGFQGTDEAARVGVYIPQSSERFLVADENFISSGYGLTTTFEEETGNRSAIWSVRQASGDQVIYYRAVVYRIRGLASPEIGPRDIQREDEDFAPSELELDDADTAAMDVLISAVEEESADLETFVASLMRRLNADAPGDAVSLLLGNQPTADRRARIAAEILERTGYDARAVHGIDLADTGREVSFVHWVEVRDDNAWQAYQVSTGRPGVPDTYMVWWRGSEEIFDSSGARNLSITVSNSPRVEDAIRSALLVSDAAGQVVRQFSLFDLPIDTQLTYRFLLMVPVGAFLLVIFRQLIGVQTFGTFMPVLIAMAFRETALINGIILFSLVVALGLSVRFYLERLKLLMVPRVACVLIVVVMLMAAIALLSNRMGLALGLSISLFPMVIMTMTIERMSVVWEENGPQDAIKQALGSLAVASVAYWVMNIPILEHLTFTFPELMLVLLAATLLLGRYTGYRLVELYRFREFAKLAK